MQYTYHINLLPHNLPLTYPLTQILPNGFSKPDLLIVMPVQVDYLMAYCCFREQCSREDKEQLMSYF